MKKVNISMLAEGIAFSLLGIMLFMMAISGAYMYYVTPRTVPYLYFAGAILILLGVFAFCRLFQRVHIKHYSHLLVLLIPMLLITWSINNDGIIDKLSASAQEAARMAAAGENTYSMKAEGYIGRILYGYDEKSKRIDISEEETYYWLTEIFNDPEPFLGYTITTMGQVMKDPEYFDQGCFSPVRKLMTCCAADLYPIGFTCEYERSDDLQTDDWVKVTGKLEQKNFEDHSELRIIADSVTNCEASREPYVYPY